MKEHFSPEQPQMSTEEYRQNFFEELKRNTRVFSADEYQKIYTLHEKYWGINSPACVLDNRLFSRHPHAEVIPNDIEKDLIAINGESVPDPDFVRYLETHEHWEVYIGKKKGFNLGKHSTADHKLPMLEKKRSGHRYATLKEFQAAEEDGKLDEYMQWWREFYQTDIEQIQIMSEEKINRISKNYGENEGDKNMIIQFIQKNLKIKENTYEKIVSKRKK